MLAVSAVSVRFTKRAVSGHRVAGAVRAQIIVSAAVALLAAAPARAQRLAEIAGGALLASLARVSVAANAPLQNTEFTDQAGNGEIVRFARMRARAPQARGRAPGRRVPVEAFDTALAVVALGVVLAALTDPRTGVACTRVAVAYILFVIFAF